MPRRLAEAASVSDGVLLSVPGSHIGPYKLLQVIGEGGFGVVYMAEQEKPIRRRVALKVIKPGMDTKQVIARFEAERQALAMMDHPNIAKVFDAGYDRGRPSLLRDGARQGSGRSPSTATRTTSLDTRAARELFADVCQARSSTPTRRASSIGTSSRRT